MSLSFSLSLSLSLSFIHSFIHSFFPSFLLSLTPCLCTLAHIISPPSLETLTPFSFHTFLSFLSVASFASKTGDYATLSRVDLRVLALAYDLEKQTNGVEHLRAEPPTVQVYTHPIHYTFNCTHYHIYTCV